MLFYQSRPDLFKTITDSLKQIQRKAIESPFEKNAIKVDTATVKRKIKSKLVN